METDVIVVGAGNGGLCVAISAAEEGARVILLDISSQTGGGSLWSGGGLHCVGLHTWEDYLNYTEGLHDPVLGKRYVETFRKIYIPWLARIGAYFSGPGTGKVSSIFSGTGSAVGWDTDYLMGKGEPGMLGNRKYFDSLEEIFRAKGGTLRLKTRILRLLADEQRNVMGVRASTWHASPLEKGQETFDIKAKTLVLATGNFLNNPEMMQKYIAPYGDKARPMGVPYSRGDGIAMAREVGAALSGGMSTWSGIECALTPRKALCADPEAYETVLTETSPEALGQALWHGRLYPPGWLGINPALMPGQTLGILVNLDGKRFIDEAGPMASKYPRRPQAILNQRQGMAFLIGDQAIHDSFPYSKPMIDLIVKEEGHVIMANSLETFTSGLAQFGVYQANLLRTITEYNTAVKEERGMELDPPRYDGFHPISTPPFYAIPVTAQVYMTFGGLAINENCEVLGMQQEVIPGLYAVPPLAGGLMNTIYTGAIACAGTFGYIAGKSVTKFIK